MATIEEMRAALLAPKKQPSIEEMRAALVGSPSKIEAEEEKVLNEISDIPLTQRAAVKNFGGSLEDQINYLKRESPDLEISQSQGEIIARKPGETSWKKLDPSGWANLDPREAFRDLLDVGTEVVSGAITAAGTAAATLPAAVYTGGIGAVPTAAAVSGTLGAGTEYIRQKLGQRFGTAGETNVGDIALVGGLSALTGGLLGGGATAKQIATQAAKPATAAKVLKKTNLGFLPKGEAPSAIQQKLVEEYLSQAQKGVGQRVAGKSLQVLSGAAPKKTLENAVKDVDQTIVGDLAESGLSLDPNAKYTNMEIAQALESQGGLTGFGGVASDTAFSAVQNVQNKLSNAYTTALESTGKKFEITQYKDAIEALIDRTRKSEIPAVQQQGEAAQKILAKYFTPKQQLKENIFNAAGEQIENLATHKGPIFNEAGNQIERRSLRAGKEYFVTGSEAMDINNALSAFMDYTKSPLALSNQSAEDKLLRNLVGDAKEGLQDQIYKTIDSFKDSPDESLRNLYKMNREYFRDIAKYFATPEKAVKTLENINNKSMRILKEKLGRFDEAHQTNLLKLADLADVAKYFGDPSLEAISSGGATSTGKILRASELLGSGGYALGLMSGVPGVAPASLAAGRATGSILASPAAVATYLSGKTAARRTGEALKAGAAQAIEGTPAQSVVNRLNQAAQYIPEGLKPALTPQGLSYSAWQLMGGK